MTDVMERLNASTRPADAPHEPREGWRVTGMETASWASRKAAEKARERDQINAWRETEVRRINEAADAEVKRIESDLEFFTHALGVYLQTLVAEGRKTKTLDLPHGKVSMRARPVSFDLDETKALDWARTTHPELLRVKESLDKSAWKKAIALGDEGAVVDADTGEVLEFARWHDAGESITFTPAGES